MSRKSSIRKLYLLPHKATNYTPDSKSSKNSFSPSRTLASQLSSGKCRFPHSEANNAGFLECKYIGQFETLAYSALLDVPTSAVQALRSTDSLIPTTADPSEGNTYRLGGVIVDVIRRDLTCAHRSQSGNATDFQYFLPRGYAPQNGCGRPWAREGLLHRLLLLFSILKQSRFSV